MSQEAEAPNITGGTDIARGGRTAGFTNFTGAFTSSNAKVAGDSYAYANQNNQGFLFNASNCSSIYKDGATTIRPDSITTYFYLKY